MLRVDPRQGGHVLWEEMPCGRRGLMGGQVLLEDMSFSMTFLWVNVSYRRSCFARRHVSWGDMSSGWHILEKMCSTEKHVLQEDRSYWRVCVV